MSRDVPELRRRIDKAERLLRTANERITLLSMERDEALQTAARAVEIRDVISRIYMGFLMEARTVSELRTWFGAFLREATEFAESGDQAGGRALLERHGVSLRTPSIEEITSGRWANSD
jgi:hypothetical protein